MRSLFYCFCFCKNFLSSSVFFSILLSILQFFHVVTITNPLPNICIYCRAFTEKNKVHLYTFFFKLSDSLTDPIRVVQELCWRERQIFMLEKNGRKFFYDRSIALILFFIFYFFFLFFFKEIL